MTISNGNAEVTYGKGGGSSNETVSGQWEKTITGDDAQKDWTISAYPSFDIDNETPADTKVTCTITVDGKQVSHQEATGDNATYTAASTTSSELTRRRKRTHPRLLRLGAFFITPSEKERQQMETTQKVIAAMLAIMFPIALAGGCGSQTTSNQPASANSQTNSQDSGDDSQDSGDDSQDSGDDSQDSTDGDGGSPLADGLAGSCEGSDPRLRV